MKYIDENLFTELATASRQALRQRVHRNFHESEARDPVQRLFIGMQPGSYIRPHRHPEPNKWEFFLVLRGRVAFLVYDTDGTVHSRHELGPGGDTQGIEIPPDLFHNIAALEADTVILEVKEGPYVPMADKNFAVWAPAEGEEGAEAFEYWCRSAGPGGHPTKRNQG